VQKLQLPNIKGINEGDMVHVSFEKGSKSVNTTELALAADPEDEDVLAAEFNQVVRLRVTLYRDSKDNYQVKHLFSK
jgi:hypothetical protein